MSTPRRKKVSDAIRILQRKRDASARATHLMVGKDPLITYEKALTDQAEGGIVPNSTLFERKIMSTKTSIKRIALVAAAALTIGGFSAVSAQAATYGSVDASAGSISHTASTATAGGTATAVGDGAHYVTVQLTTGSADTAYSITSSGVGSLFGTATASYVSGSPESGTATITYANGTNTVGGLTWGATTSIGQTATKFTAGSTLSFAAVSSVAGTQTVTFTPVNGTNSAFTEVITWGAAPAFSAGNSTTYFYETTSATVATVDSATISADATTPVSKSAGLVGTIRVRLVDNEATPVGLSGKTISASVSGPGLILGMSTTGSTSLTATGATGAATATTNADGYAVFSIASSGVAGVGTFTVTYTDASGNVTTLGTKAVTFYNTTPASLSATQNLSVGTAGAALGITSATNTNNTLVDVAHTPAIILKALDAAGNIVGGLASGITATSSNTNVLSSTISVSEDNGGATYSNGAGYYIITPTFAAGAASGASATLTLTWTSSDGLTKVISAPVTFTVGGTTIYSIAASGDKSSYSVGDKATLTLTAKDSAGNAIADGNYKILHTTNSAAYAGLTTSAAVTTPLFGNTASDTSYVQFVGGKATTTYFVPVSGGPFSASATLTTDSSLSSALQGTTLSYATTIASAGSGDASLALDAANAATDAANNAYDEAQNATQAASDALAAVKALAVQVKALIALVTKIKNKVGA